MKKIVISIGLAMAIVGCTSTEQVAKIDGGGRVVTQEELDAVGYECRMVKNTTSRIKKKVCTTAAQREARSENSKKMLSELRTGRGNPTPLEIGG